VNSEGDGPAADDLRPDFEAEEVTKKSRLADSPNRVNKEDLFKPVKTIERERLEASGAADFSPERFGVDMGGEAGLDVAKSTKSKKKLKKKKTKKRKAKEEEEDDSSSEEEKEEE